MLSYAKHCAEQLSSSIIPPLCQRTVIVESIITMRRVLTCRGSSGARRGTMRAREERRANRASALTWAARLNYYPRVVCQQQKFIPQGSEAVKSKTSPGSLQIRAWEGHESCFTGDALLCVLHGEGQASPSIPRMLGHPKTWIPSWPITSTSATSPLSLGGLRARGHRRPEHSSVYSVH